jgi:hypothetical protein
MVRQPDEPVRLRFRQPLTLLPLVAGVATAIPLWSVRAEPAFFDAAAHVIAIGGIGLVIQGRFFRLRQHVTGAPSDAYAIVSVVTVMITVGIGLGFSFAALARGEAHVPDTAMVAGSLATGVAAFAVVAMFGTPGAAEEEDDAE